jgi:hypothetical protein
MVKMSNDSRDRYQGPRDVKELHENLAYYFLTRFSLHLLFVSDDDVTRMMRMAFSRLWRTHAPRPRDFDELLPVWLATAHAVIAEGLLSRSVDTPNHRVGSVRGEAMRMQNALIGQAGKILVLALTARRVVIAVGNHPAARLHRLDSSVARRSLTRCKDTLCGFREV